MKRTILCLGLSLVVNGYVFAQLKKGQVDPSKVSVPQWHYQPEFTFDVSIDPLGWIKLNSGMHVAFGSTNELYLRSEVPANNQEIQEWEETGWRGERLNAQVLVWSADTIKQIRFKVSDLSNATGSVISKDCIELNMVRYVLSNFPYADSNFSCEVSNDSAYLMPDRLETFERFDLPGKTVRPVWISINIPSTSDPGNYKGIIEINSTKEKAILKLNVNVQKQTLPNPHDWKFRLDLWQNPWVIAWYYNVEPWSDEHKVLLRKHLKLYADAGGKYITTYAIYSPWSDNSYMIEGTMIDWMKTADGSWKFNYSIFDQYVELAMSCGIDKAITVYTPVPWGHRFRYLDEKTGNYIYEEWSPKSVQFETFWNIFLDDLKKHLTEKDWFEKCYLGINENPLEYTLAAVKVIREHSDKWKITYAGEWHPELSSLLDDYSLIKNNEPSSGELQERSAKGYTTTYYICCNPPKPNTFVFSPPVEGRYLGWYAIACGYDGLLRWAYDAWTADPLRDARHTLWPAGDCFLVYPGGNSSIRFEKLREGIVDYEKILILRELTSKSKNNNVKNLMNELEKHLETFIEDPDVSKRDYNYTKLTEAILNGKTLINTLSDELAK